VTPDDRLIEFLEREAVTLRDHVRRQREMEMDDLPPHGNDGDPSPRRAARIADEARLAELEGHLRALKAER
jgi:hypothetical protein